MNENFVDELLKRNKHFDIVELHLYVIENNLKQLKFLEQDNEIMKMYLRYSLESPEATALVNRVDKRARMRKEIISDTKRFLNGLWGVYVEKKRDETEEGQLQ